VTDARLPERLLNDRRLQRLNPAEHYRAYVNSLMYAVSNRTDGYLTPHDLDAIPHFKPESIAALIEAELWTAGEEGWIISDYLTTQTSRAQLEAAEHARIKDAERKARDRASKRAPFTNQASDSWNPADSPADNTTESRNPVDGRPDNIGQDKDRPETGKVLPAVQVQKQTRKVTRAFPDCSTPGCGGKLNQAALDAGAEICADCVWNGRVAS